MLFCTVIELQILFIGPETCPLAMGGESLIAGFSCCLLDDLPQPRRLGQFWA
jgi:hypothetical protein